MPDFRRFLLGPKLSSDDIHHTKLSNFLGLSVFSSDALSSTAYATQEIMASLSTVLGHPAFAGAAGAGAAFIYGLSIPVAIGITCLLLILGASYRQTILAYPKGAGTYLVAMDNLGEVPALVGGASLLLDYTLTVAVSVSAGISAITSALPSLQGSNVTLTVIAICLVAVANLRGVKESGTLFAVPTYGFILVMFTLLGTGFVRWLLFGAGPAPTQGEIAMSFEQTQNLTGLALVWIFMRAFSAGCTALTGIEAISDGVTAFKEPTGHNAAKTMVWMIALLGTIFMGVTVLSHHYGVRYAHSNDPTHVAETLLSHLAKAIYQQESWLGRAMYYITQTFTFLILLVASNTAFADFPRLAAFMGKDAYLPKQFAGQGDRLVYSNGIFILTFMACLLVIGLHANTDVLLPLYALGVFLSFTISQSGMIVHWWRRRKTEPKWRYRLAINTAGAIASGLVGVDIAITKFSHGAWIVVILIPLMVIVFFRIHRHYIGLKAKLAASRLEGALPSKHHALVLVSSLHKGVVEALAYARLISGDRVEALTVDLQSDGFNDSPALQKLRSDWVHYGMGVPLRSVPSPYRRIVEPILEEIDRFQLAEPDVCLTVILPEFVTSHWWERVLHGQMAIRIKTMLMLRKGVIVTSVRMHLPD